MLPDRVSNPGPLAYESGALPIALRGPARTHLAEMVLMRDHKICFCGVTLHMENHPLILPVTPSNQEQ